MDNSAKYNNVFNTIFNIKVEELDHEVDTNSLHDWNSITHLRLVTNIEDEFNVMFEPEDILEFKSFQTGKEILKKYGVEF